MRKIMIALCSVAVIFACDILIPISVHAQGKSCNHDMNGQYIVEETVFLYSHQILIHNGDWGPEYDNCEVKKKYTYVYPRCSKCGYVFSYNTPTVTETIVHENPNCPLH